jgi:tetratricopeptide (TPR) repeat protein
MKAIKTILLVAIMVSASTLVYAQEETDAINSYNEALSLAQNKDFKSAIDKFGEAIELAESIGNTDIASRSRTQIPKLYYQKAAKAFKDFKSSPSISNLDITISEFKESQAKGNQYSDSDISNRSKGVLAQLYFQKGSLLYKKEDFVGADVALNEAITINANYAKAYYQKGLVSKNLNQNDIETMLSWFDRAIAVGEQVNDADIVRLSNKKAHAELLYNGVQAIEQNQFSKALEMLQRSLDYNNKSADSYYRLSELSNKQNNFDSAIEFGNKAIELEQGGSTDKAKIYFEIGFAQQMKDNIPEACSAFADALYGSFKASSEHKMKFELKCESTK